MTNPFESLAPTERYVETPYGRLYRPLSQGRQILVLIGSFLGSVGAGSLITAVAGDLSELAQALVTAPFMLVFFFGYAAWVARTSAIATKHLGWPLIKAFWTLIVKRQAPERVEDLISAEMFVEMAVKAQAAGASFRRVGYSLAGIFGIFATQIDTSMGGAAMAVLVTSGTLAWGLLLGHLGRTGWLPIAED